MKNMNVFSMYKAKFFKGIEITFTCLFTQVKIREHITFLWLKWTGHGCFTKLNDVNKTGEIFWLIKALTGFFCGFNFW